MKTRLLLPISIVALLLAMSFSASADQVYRWVDKDGHVHYSQTPPPSTSVTAQTVDINPPVPDPTTLQNEKNLAKQLQDKDKQDQKAQEQAAKDAQAQQQKQQACDDLHTRLQVLLQSGRVATVDAQGNKSYVSDDDRAKQEQQLQDRIAAECSNK